MPRASQDPAGFVASSTRLSVDDNCLLGREARLAPANSRDSDTSEACLARCCSMPLT